MAFRLVIAEKPSVAQTIAAALGIKGKQDGYIEGGGYLISWCVGHLVQLAEAAAYGEQYKKWSFDSLPILPEEWQYAVDPDKGKQFKTLKELMHRADVSEVVNACDAGREGELIFRFVYEAAGCKKPMRRLWISSMEDGAIKAGFASLKDGREYDALFASALCRAKADWLIGINATRLFSCLYGKTLNVGRVQTPTLKMLTDRDAAISHFQKEKYYHVRLDLSGADAASERISDKAEADALKGACEAGKAVCVSLTREKKTAAPPKLFDLTSLQRETNRIFGYTAKQTLDLAQSLYEKRLLTYPRTDSSFLTDDMGGTAADIIALLCEKLPFMAGADFTPEVAKVTDSKKVSDHHAIIPTMELAKTELAALPESEKNILTLTGARLLSATAEPHIFEAVTAVFSCAGTDFTARGKTVLAEGWKELERRYRATLKDKPEAEDGENEGVLAAAKSRQDFTANVSHELKTPLTAISGYAELIENGMVEKEQQIHFATEIRRNAQRLLSLINDIIKLSELDSSEAQQGFEQLDLYGLVKDCMENLQVNAEQRKVALNFDGTDCMVRGNRQLLTELVENLCQNAIRYNNEGGTVNVTVHKLGGKTVLTVEDNGIGIPKDQQERVFERFYRVDKSRSKETGGTGLGLAIVKHIVQLHDAELTLDSEVGRGTTIKVEF